MVTQCGITPVLYDTRYYIPPGKRIEDVRINDRVASLHISQEGWKQITRHLERKQKIEQAAEAIRERARKLKEGSYAMTKNWHDSAENISIRQGAERATRTERREQAMIDRYFKITSEAVPMRQELLKQKRYQAFKLKGEQKSLNVALRMAHVMAERNKHIELKKKIAESENKIEEAWADHVRKDAEAFREEKRKENRMLHQEKKAFRDYLIVQKLELDRKLRDEAEKTLVEDILAHRGAAEHRDRMKSLEQEDYMKRCKLSKERYKKYMERQQHQKQLQAEEDEEMHLITTLFTATKDRIAGRMKKKQREEIERVLQAQCKAKEKLVAMQKAKDEIREEVIENAIAEKELDAQEKAKELVAVKMKIKQERIEEWKRHLQRTFKQKEEREEVNRWLMANRVKASQIMNEYDQKKIEEIRKRKLDYGKELKEQRKMNTSMKDIEAIRDRRYISKELANEDKDFFEYAETIRKIAKEKDLPSYPIEKCIMDYKKKYNMYKAPRVPQNCELYNEFKSGLVSLPQMTDQGVRNLKSCCPRRCKNKKCLRHQLILEENRLKTA